MGFFNFVETFFFISLAITFVLIMMLVYHFKERLSILEKKTNTMFDIINNIVKEITGIKYNLANQPSFDTMNVLNIPVSDTFREMNEKIPVSDDEDDEEDEYESDDDFEEEVVEEVKHIKIENSDKPIELEIEEAIVVNKVQDEPIIDEKPTSESIDLTNVYRKMEIGALRQLVITRGLTSDTKGMKKMDLIRLLESHSEKLVFYIK